MQLKDDHKVQILMVELQERYNASHKMRERSTQFAIWLSGIAIGLAWLLICQKSLMFSQRLALTLLIAILWIGAGIFILGMRRGFQSNRRAMIRTEKALGMYDIGVYLPEKPLLPGVYVQTNGKWNDHFSTLCAWLFIVALSLMVLTWTCSGQPKNVSSPDKKIDIIKGGKKNG